MKKRIATLLLALAICAGMAVPAAAVDTSGAAARAVTVFENFMRNPPASSDDYFNKYASHFYMDFDANGIPELVVLYTSSRYSHEDLGARIYAYTDNASNISLSKIEPVMVAVPNEIGVYYDYMIGTSFGASGGIGLEIDRYANGTYGFCWYDFGTLHTGWTKGDYYDASKKQFLRTGTLGERVYVFSTYNSYPDTYQYFSKPKPVAYASTYPIMIDGSKVNFNAYSIRNVDGDVNYINLRDMAYALNGTAAQFSVGWDTQSSSIVITTGAAYSAVGGELSARFSGSQAYTDYTSNILINGVSTKLNAFTLNDAAGNGYTYFKLRDLGKALGFDVAWDSAKNQITINSKAGSGTEQSSGLQLDTYYMDLLGYSKSELQQMLGAPTGVDEYNCSIYQNGKVSCNFDGDICKTLVVPMSSAVKNMGNTITLDEVRSLFGSGEVAYDEYEGGWYIGTTYKGEYVSIRYTEADGTTYASSYILIKAIPR